MKEYRHQDIESKWQDQWLKDGIYHAQDNSGKPKYYALVEFPYPSGDGLHTGHARSYTAMDVISRQKRMAGHNVLYPIGWDAFGLPTENYAIKTGIDPQTVTKQNTDTFRRQLQALGISFDWSREINTTDPSYYKWTQWIFLQLFKKGLAYKKKTTINWCPKDKIGLANEEVQAGMCERCGTAVEQKEKEQWLLKITDYAQRLYDDLDTVDYIERAKIQQRNWIGPSEGAEIEFVLRPETEPTFYQFFEPGKIRETEPYVERNGVIALVKHWSEDKYLGLSWKKVNWETLITGGLEAGQSPEETARAEIVQETGYKNMRLVKEMGKMNSCFFHVPKNHNRKAAYDIFYFELVDDEREGLATEEKAQHEPVWLTREEMVNFGLPSSHRYVWDLYQNGGKPTEKKLKVFTTRPDTIFGVTYLALAPTHPLVNYFIHQAANAAEIDAFIKSVGIQTREAEKTGVELRGVKAINPVNGEELPVWVVNYVSADYGTGAIMAVPAHDERDFEFAKKYNLPIRPVVTKFEFNKDNPPREGKKETIREVIHAVLRNPQDDTYLVGFLKGEVWGDTKPVNFVIGGVEEGEDFQESARREIMEETGYSDFVLAKELPIEFTARFFQAQKDVNRTVHIRVFFFDLKSDRRKEVDEQEALKHDFKWLPADEVEAVLNVPVDKVLWSYYRSGGFAYPGDGKLVNSGQFTGLSPEAAKQKITESVGGVWKTTYKLRDWIFSRQRYWGEPIPLVNCGKCGWVPVPEDQLPVELPKVEKYQPTDTGESPLANITDWVETTCPTCGGRAKRETDVMPNWAGSSWYYLAYCLSENFKSQALISKQIQGSEIQNKIKYWNPVDWYNGGMEHTVLHLLYSRFWHKFLYDLGVVPTSEPYAKRTSHGLILAEGGEKMSKSKGNVVNPDSIVEKFGADTLRLYEMFMGPFDQAVAWSTDGIVGPRRFLERVWKLQTKLSFTNSSDVSDGKHGQNLLNKVLSSLSHATIKKVTEDIAAMRFNTAVSALMIWLSALEKAEQVSREDGESFLKLLAPFAPHIAEELWSRFGYKNSIHLEPWPVFDPAKLELDRVSVVIQVDGKVRDTIAVDRGLDQETVQNMALNRAKVAKWLVGKSAKRIVYVPDKLLNFVLEGGDLLDKVI